MKDLIRVLLREAITKCPELKLTDEIISEVNRFENDEAFLRGGGLSIQALDRAAYGFSSEDIKTIMPDKLKILWVEDLENVQYEIKHKGLTNMQYAKNVNLSEPIEVDYMKPKGKTLGFYIQDGHHRYWAAKILNKPLNVELSIKYNPLNVLAKGLGYDDYMRCIFHQAKTK